MYRLINRKHLYPVNITNTLSIGLSKEGYNCNYCREMFRKQVKPGNEFYFCQMRHQTTRTALTSNSSKRKKINKKLKRYVELLEVYKNKTNETTASVHNLKLKHLSKFISNPGIELDQLHKLTNPPGKKKDNRKGYSSSIDTLNARNALESDIKIDYTLIEDAHRAILTEYKRIEDVPLSNMDTSSILLTSSRWHNYDFKIIDKKLMKIIKESYDKFRRDTLVSETLRDLSQAMNDGLNYPFNIHNLSSEKTLNYSSIEKIERPVINKSLEQLLDTPGLESNLLLGSLNEEFNEEVELHEEIHEMQNTKEENTNPVPDEILTSQPNTEKETAMKSKEAIKVVKRLRKRKQIKKPLMKNDIMDLKLNCKEESLKNILAAHLEMCVLTNALDKAFQILIYYRKRGKVQPKDKPRNRAQVKDVSLYNILLHGYADKGNYTRVADILKIMKEDGIIPNIQSYAAIFECIEKSHCKDKNSLLQKYKIEMESKDISLNDLIDKAKFVKDQHAAVLSAIQRFSPTFNAIHNYAHLDYVCPLLQDINLQNPNAGVSSREGLKISPAAGLLTLDELKQKLTEQMENEMNGMIYVRNINSSDKPSEEVLSYRRKLEILEREWRQSVKNAFIKNLATLKLQTNASHSALNIYPYLTVLEVDAYVDLIMSEVSRLAEGSESYSPSLKMMQRDIGLRLYSKFRIQMLKENGVLDKLTKIYSEYCEWYLNRNWTDPQEQYYNSRQKWQMLMHKYRDGVSPDVSQITWPNNVCQNIGRFLYNIILHDLKINVNMDNKNSKPRMMAITYSITRWSSHIFRTEVKVHPLLWRIWRGACRSELAIRTSLAPSCAPPAPWTKAGRSVAGGYLLSPPTLMRMAPNAILQWKRLEEAAPETLYPSLDSLNQLGSIPWTINQPILDLLLEVFISGGSEELDVAQPPSVLDSEMPRILSKCTKAEKAQAFKKKIAVSRRKAELYSLWCDSLYKFSLANHYRNTIFWLPHNMDFRGRVYACPPHVSILGGDTARALLKFALPKPLGPRGLRWLKLHVVNLTGTMKQYTIEERLKYADDILEDIMDSADNPLKGSRWWANSEDPWQTLACCIEITNAIRSPNHEEYLCSFPVHQDGSCNGLQHYAALGGDEAGAVSVNLTPLAKPQDVYSAVVTLVEDARKRDAASGLEIAQILDGFITRKVIKQTVMTTVYGVTKFGARLQIAKKLRDIDDFPKDKVWESSTYLAGKTFDSLREMFTSAKEIQDWFTECAKLISGVCCESVEWVTPLGLPVVQPYHKQWNNNQATSLPSVDGVILSDKASLDQYERPCIVKQKNAFPPNFIHSLDSTHMMLTSLQSEATGITFVSVHDCFWTHPYTVDEMNKICRKEFVSLHSQPILKDLSNFLVKRYGYEAEQLVDDGSVISASKRRLNRVLKSLPQKGNFKLSNVIDSMYFFS